MRIKMMGIRILTSAVLFILLTQVNVWGDTLTHLVLAVGYRSFLLLAPLALISGYNFGVRISILFGIGGLALTFYRINVPSMMLFAIGMAVFGYLAKYLAAHTTEGAADNKVSLNVGSLLSGVMLLFVLKREMVLSACMLLLLLALYLSFKVDWDQIARGNHVGVKRPGAPPRDAASVIGWSLIGLATGIKLTGIFTILPQYLLLRNGVLPNWFGSLIILNSLLIIVMQHRILTALKSAKPFVTPLLSLSAMSLLALPAFLKCEDPLFAGMWIVALTLGECALSSYDKSAIEAGTLFPKELMVGVGSFLTVFLSRNFPHEIHWSGLVGFFSLSLGVFAIKYKRSATVFTINQTS